MRRISTTLSADIEIFLSGGSQNVRYDGVCLVESEKRH